MKIVGILSALLITCALILQTSFGGSAWAQNPADQVPPPNSIEDTAKFIAGPYQGLDKRAGLFNDGMAALWDLRIIDQYSIFGPKERAAGYSPEQPIAFSHVTHVQKNKMECQYCHWSVDKAAYAAIPEVQTCMGCHKLVRGKTEWQQKEISKIDNYYNSGDPIPWVKVHVMPAYVNFNHKRHVKAGVNCQECHGQVPNMPVVERAATMKMGWCVDCHRQRGTSIDCWTCHK